MIELFYFIALSIGISRNCRRSWRLIERKRAVYQYHRQIQVEAVSFWITHASKSTNKTIRRMWNSRHVRTLVALIERMKSYSIACKRFIRGRKRLIRVVLRRMSFRGSPRLAVRSGWLELWVCQQRGKKPHESIWRTISLRRGLWGRKPASNMYPIWGINIRKTPPHYRWSRKQLASPSTSLYSKMRRDFRI